MEKDLMEYLIRGKDYALKKMLISEFVAILCWLIICLWLLNFGLVGFLDLVFIAVALVYTLGINLWYINHYFFYRIEIYSDRFFVRTNPFNAKCYYFNEVTSAKIKCKKRCNKKREKTKTFSFFRFRDSEGKRRKVYFNDEYCINEIRLIVDRISK